MTSHRDYWPYILSRMRPGDAITCATRKRAELVCRNGWRRGWTLWRRQVRPWDGDPYYVVTLAHNERATVRERRARR